MDKKPEKMVPEVRFKGFTDDWEQRKLGELGSVQMNKRIFKNQTSKSGDVPFYKIGTFGKKADAYISNSLYQDYKEKYPYPSKGDLLISASGSIGRIVEYKGQKAYYQDSNIVWLEHNNHVLNSFLKAFYQIVKWDGTEGSTIKRLYNKNILNTKIKLPKVREQKTIGTLISKVDLLLSLQQRKLEQLKQLKKAMLQQLLVSKKGKLISNIRFKDFTETWEQRKLGDVATFSKGSGYSKSDLKSSGTPVILYGRLYTNYELVINSINTFTSAKNNSVYSKGGEVIVPASGETAKDISIASVVNKPNFLLGGDLNIIHPNKNIKSIFLAVSISNGETKKDMARRAQGKSIVHLHNTDLSQIKLAYPSEAEQEKIDSYFLKFDSLIALHQRRLNQISKVKKFCLQKMFI